MNRVFDDSQQVTSQTVVLIFLFYGYWFYPSETVVAVELLVS